MATVTLSGLSCVHDRLVISGTSTDVQGDHTIWVRVGNSWFKPKVDADGDWRVAIDHDRLDPGESLDITAGVYLHPAHRPHVGAHKVLVSEDAFDTATLTRLEDGASLVANGSFEDTSFLAPNTWDIIPVPGWNGTDGEIEVWNNLTDHGPEASDGDQNIELDSDGRADVVSQTIATVAGAEYELSFDYASRNVTAGPVNTTDAFTVWWNGVQVGAFDPVTTDWATAVILVTGTGSDLLEFREAGANDSLGALLDAVGLSATDDCGGWVLA